MKKVKSENNLNNNSGSEFPSVKEKNKSANLSSIKKIANFLHLRGVKALPVIAAFRRWQAGHLGGVFLAMTFFVILACPGSAFASEIANQFTVSLWVNPTTSITSKALMGKAEEIRLFTDSSGYPGCQLKATTWQTAATATIALSLNTWSHISCTYNKVSLTLFVNGVQSAQTSLTSTVDDTANTFLVGEDDSASTTYTNFIGAVDQFQVYNYARSAKQIVEDMNAGHPAVGSPIGSAVAHWKFDEGALNICTRLTNDYHFCDSTPNGNTLDFSSFTGGFTNSGKFGKAFDGTGDVWASRADDSDFDVSDTDDYAISLWFKSDSANNPGAIEYLFNKADATTAGYAVYANISGNICFGIDDDTTWGPDISSCSPTDIYDNTWHHIVAVRDHNNTDKTLLYVDGVLKDSDSDTTTATLANSLLLYVADRDGVDNGDELNGDIDELKVYRYTLTPNEILTEFNRGSSLLMGALGSNSTYQSNASNQEYCIPGDTTSCAAPIGEWKFEEGSGSTAYDTSGNGYNGTYVDSPVVKKGKIGKALTFDGVDDGVSCTDANCGGTGSIGLDLGLKDMTLEAWVKIETTPTGTEDVVMSKIDGTTLDGYYLSVNSSNRMTCLIRDEGTAFACPDDAATLTVNKWYHMALTIDNNGSVSRYLDGIKTGTDVDISTHTDAIDSNQDFCIGARETGCVGRFINASVDEAKVYNYIRTPAQIAWDYNRGVPVAHWKLDECQGASAYDSSGNNNTGTITIGASGEDTLGTCTTSSTAWGSGATGKKNASLSLDGTDDYVSVSDSNSLDATNVTLSAWINKAALGTTKNVVSKWSSQGGIGNQYSYYMAVLSSNDLSFQMDPEGNPFSGNGCARTTTSTISASTWYHIVATFDSGTVKIYRNGVEQPATTSGTCGSSIYQGTAPLNIGSVESGTTNYFDGQIDDVKIFNYALTAAQVKDLYNGGALFFGPSTGSP